MRSNAWLRHQPGGFRCGVTVGHAREGGGAFLQHQTLRCYKARSCTTTGQTLGSGVGVARCLGNACLGGGAEAVGELAPMGRHKV